MSLGASEECGIRTPFLQVRKTCLSWQFACSLRKCLGYKHVVLAGWVVISLEKKTEPWAHGVGTGS